jgi:hypothetical protein
LANNFEDSLTCIGFRNGQDVRRRTTPVVATAGRANCDETEPVERIDILKLDCEGSEFSILGKTASLDRIGLIVGEYHGKEKFRQLIADRFAGWELRVLRDGELGTFWLANPALIDLDVKAKTDDPKTVASPSIRLAGEQAPTFRGCLDRLRRAAQSSTEIVVEHFSESEAIRRACDTFTSEHPEFQRQFAGNGEAGSLIFERRTAP